MFPPRNLRSLRVSALNAILLLSLSALCYSQFGRGAGEWNTTGADAQRSSWVRSDAKISAPAIRKGGFGLAWNLKLADATAQDAFAGDTVLLNGYIGYRGFRSLGYIAGSSGRIYAIDTDLGRLEWQKPLGRGGISANVARAVSAAFPATPGTGRGGFGRGNAAKSGVGEADQGAVTIKEIAEREAAMASAMAGRGPGGGPGFGPGGPPRRMPNYLHAISADGVFHSMYVSNGEEPEQSVPFLPADAKAGGLIALNDVAYAVAADTVWALDLESHKVASWKAAGRIAAGPAIAPDGTVYVTTASGDLAALGAKTLAARSTYAAHAAFTSAPVLFQFQDKTLVAAATKDNHIHLLDAAALDKPYVPQSIGFAADDLASWQDTSGTRWILASSPASVMAWKLVEKDGAPALVTGWTVGLTLPSAPLIINGVVFVFDRGGTFAPAALHALDGISGADIWNSGKTITSGPATSLSAGGSQIYLATRDGVLYAFGFPIEH
jgi:outer membrane protein assembly factor BamB